MKTSQPRSPSSPLAAMLSACSPKAARRGAAPVRTAEASLRAARARRTATSAPCSRATKSTRRSASAARSSSARSTSARCVHEGDVLAVLDDTDYRLAEEAARQQLDAARRRRARPSRIASASRPEVRRLGQRVRRRARAERGAHDAQAAAEAEAKQARPRAQPPEVHRAACSSSGVVTSVRFEVGQVVAEGQPVVSIADEGEPEIVVDVPEDQVAAFKNGALQGDRSRARPTKPSTWSCANFRRRPRRRRARTARG